MAVPALVQNLGASFNKTAGTALAHTFTGATTAGNLIVARVLFDNFTTASKPIVSSIGKMAGETANWLLLGAARSTSTSLGAFASGEMWCIQTTVAWTAAAYTTTLDSSVTMKAVHFQEFSGAQAVLRSTVGTNYSTSTTAASAATTGTTPVINDLALGFIFGSNVAAAQAGDNDTSAGSWSAVSGLGSTGSGAATNNFGIGQYKVLTAATAQTYNNSATMTAGNGSIVAILQSIPEPAITQAAYRFYADGTETGSTALANQDTALAVGLSDVNLQLRMRLQATTATAIPGTDDFTLQWEKNVSGTWATVSSIAESLPFAQQTVFIGLSTTAKIAIGQSFIGNGGSLTRAGFMLDKFGTPAGYNVTAYLYAHTGTFGTTGLGAEPALATSTTAFTVDSLTTTFTATYFDFDGSVVLTNGTPYVIAVGITTSSPSGSNFMRVGIVNVTTAHAGSASLRSTVGTWQTLPEQSTPDSDVVFEVYATSAVAPYDSTNLTEGAATTNRLTGGTGSFVAGKVSEDGVVDNVGWSANNYTELLYSVKLVAAQLVGGDILRFRVLRNGATTGLTYTAMPRVNVIAVTQEGFRWRNDDGSQTSATWKEAQDTNTPLALATPARLRVLLDSTGDPAPAAYTLYYKKTTDSTWLAVPVGSGGGSPVYIATSANIAASGEATTAQLSAPAGKTTADFSVGRMWDDENGTDLVDIVPLYRNVVLADSPWVYCQLESFGATTPDSSGNGRTVNVGNTQYTGLATGKVGSGFEANPTGSCSFIPQTQTPSNPPPTYSWEIWFRTNRASQMCWIGMLSDPLGADGTEDGAVYVDASGNVNFRGWDTTAGADRIATTSGVNCIDNTWHHMVATTSAANGKRIYIDGTLRGTGLHSTNTGFGSSYLRFGGIYPGGAPSWASAGSQAYSVTYIDEVAWYTTELTAARVLAHYEAA